LQILFLSKLLFCSQIMKQNYNICHQEKQCHGGNLLHKTTIKFPIIEIKQRVQWLLLKICCQLSALLLKLLNLHRIPLKFVKRSTHKLSLDEYGLYESRNAEARPYST